MAGLIVWLLLSALPLRVLGQQQNATVGTQPYRSFNNAPYVPGRLLALEI